mgnify:CR=1 FL=1
MTIACKNIKRHAEPSSAWLINKYKKESKMKKLIFSLLFTFACTAIFAIAYTAKWNEEWEKLTEEEQWFCLLSEPLTERNALSIISVNPEPFVPEGKQSHSQGILEN